MTTKQSAIWQWLSDREQVRHLHHDAIIEGVQKEYGTSVSRSLVKKVFDWWEDRFDVLASEVAFHGAGEFGVKYHGGYDVLVPWFHARKQEQQLFRDALRGAELKNLGEGTHGDCFAIVLDAGRDRADWCISTIEDILTTRK